MRDGQEPSSPFGSAQALRARQIEWDRFHDWETCHPPTFTDLRTAWRWYEEMHELARMTGAIAAVPRVDMEKVRRIQQIQARLARLPWPK
jgi:hypothetical protein